MNGRMSDAAGLADDRWSTGAAITPPVRASRPLAAIDDGDPLDACRGGTAARGRSEEAPLIPDRRVATTASADPTADRRPLRVMFCITSMPVGGAETLLVNLIDRMDRSRLAPELCCLKRLGPLGERLAQRIPTFSHLLSHKFDLRVWSRLAHLFQRRRIDAVVTVGAGDKMFWGRLAARRAGVPVVISALHSTGWPDSVGRLNRLLTPWTDAFVAVARRHASYLRNVERFPEDRIHVIPNGVDIERFAPSAERAAVRAELGIPLEAPVVGIVAALRPEKDHGMLLGALRKLHQQVPDARLLVVGDGPQRGPLERQAANLGIARSVHFLGNRYDTERLLAAIDCFALSSRNEASPVSILEAMATALPVVATRVGSVPESVLEGQTGYLVSPGDGSAMAERLARLLGDGKLARRFGAAGRAHVQRHGSLETMVDGYHRLIEDLYRAKRSGSAATAGAIRCGEKAAPAAE